MQIDTKAYGAVEIDPRQIISFPQGLYGFETLGEYALIDARQPPFLWLQSLESKSVAFILVNPVIIRKDYNALINPSELEAIGLRDTEDENFLQFVIVTVTPDQVMTANLQGPIVINKETKVGRQCIANDERWETRHSILQEIVSSGDDSC